VRGARAYMPLEPVNCHVIGAQSQLFNPCGFYIQHVFIILTRDFALRRATTHPSLKTGVIVDTFFRLPPDLIEDG
jgi:hypothetical protein